MAVGDEVPLRQSGLVLAKGAAPGVSHLSKLAAAGAVAASGGPGDVPAYLSASSYCTHFV